MLGLKLFILLKTSQTTQDENILIAFIFILHYLSLVYSYLFLKCSSALCLRNTDEPLIIISLSFILIFLLYHFLNCMTYFKYLHFNLVSLLFTLFVSHHIKLILCHRFMYF